MTRALTALTVALVLALPSFAAAQGGNPFAPTAPPVQPQQQAPAPQPVPLPTTNRGNDPLDDEGLKTWQEIGLALLAALLIGLIGWAIARDARKVAPVDGPAPAGDDSAETKAKHRQARQQQARKRAKAARRQRKRNRAR